MPDDPITDARGDGEGAAWATRARGAGTLRAYRSAWTQYTAWCARLGFSPLTGEAEIIGLYLVH